jgi:hypothetical protein
VRSIAGKDTKAKVLFEPADYEIGLAQKFEALVKTFSPRLERSESQEGIWYREI